MSADSGGGNVIRSPGAGLQKGKFGRYYHQARESKAAQTLTTLSKTFISLTQKQEILLRNTKQMYKQLRGTRNETWRRVGLCEGPEERQRREHRRRFWIGRQKKRLLCIQSALASKLVVRRWGVKSVPKPGPGSRTEP